MARLVEAVRDYGPRIRLEPTAQLDEIAEWMATCTSLNKSVVAMVLNAVEEAILHFGGRGAPVKLPGVGTFTPSIDRHGTIKMNFRTSKVLSQRLNAPDAFTGRILNETRIGLDEQGYKMLWDAEHPENPLAV